MRQLKLCRMEALTGISFHIFAVLRKLRASVYLVAHERMTYVREMNAYLMRSARFENTFYIRSSREIFHYLYVSYGVFGVFLRDRHFLSVDTASAYREIESHVLLKLAYGDSVVYA